MNQGGILQLQILVIPLFESVLIWQDTSNLLLISFSKLLAKHVRITTMNTSRLLLYMAILSITFALCSCSRHSNGINDPVTGDLTPGTPNVATPVNHGVIAVFDAFIDPEAGIFTVEPAQRIGAFHFPLTNLFPNVLSIVGYSFGPPFQAQIRLTHPFPTSDIIAFDPRVIACLPARTGVSAQFDTLQVLTNNSVLLYPDGYTSLFDNASLPGNVNPYVAYFKSKSYRQWGAVTGVVETQTWIMDINGFGGPLSFQLVVDVSTNFPAPPTPSTDNCPEPYQMDIDIGNDLTSFGGSTGIEVFVYDWQGHETIQSVKAEAPDIYPGLIDLVYLADGPYPYSFYYAGNLSNKYHAPAGDYDVLVAATDSVTGFTAYGIGIVTVNPSPIDLVDVTPVQLNFSPEDMAIWDDWGAVAAGYNGLHIFYVGDPYALEWQSWVNPPGYINSVDAMDGYIYMCNALLGLQIVYANPADQPQIINTVTLPAPGEEILYSNGYAYVTTQNYSLEIIDVNPPANAHIVCSITLDDPGGMDIDGNYLFVADQTFGLQIIDITVPETAHIENTDYSTPECTDVAVEYDFAWMIGNMTIFSYNVYDKTHPLNYSYLNLEGNPSSIELYDYKAYVTEDNAPGSPGKFYNLNLGSHPAIVSTVTIPGSPMNSTSYGSFAFVSDPNSGIFSISLYDPQNISIINVEKTIGCAKKVSADANYAYIADGGAGLQIVDINPAGDAYIVNTVDTPNWANDVSVIGEYAYVADGGSGVQIIDINPATSAHIVGAVNTPGSCQGLYVLAGLAYVADGSSGLQIMDVDPVGSAYIMKTVDTPGNATDATLGGLGRIYVTDFNNGLVVVNANNISTAYISYTLPLPSPAEAVTFMSGYVYVANGHSGLQVINVSAPESAYIVKTADTPGYANDVFLYDNFAYVGDKIEGVAFVDISVPTNASYMINYDTPGVAEGVFVRGTTTYVADWRGGLRILQNQ
jgi:hypothetical protein